jgi:putative lipoic acid-binding regulatory protein
MQKLDDHELQFPVDWNYKIIAEKEFPDFLEGLTRVLNKFAIDDKPLSGPQSSNGKYISYRLTATFNNHEQMEQLSEAIAHVPGVKFLL